MDKKDPRDSVLIVPIFGEIDWEFADDLFTNTWEYLKVDPNVEKLVVIISSIGGDREAGWTVYQTLRAFNKEVISIALNSVYSSAIYPFLAGDRKYAFPDANFLFHPTTIQAEKEGERPLSNYEEDLKSDKTSTARMHKILKTLNVPPRIIRRMESKDKHFYVNSVQGIEYHFVDKIITSIEKPWEL